MRLLLALAFTLTTHAAPLKVLLIDGQNNHAWKQTTPLLRAILEEDALCTVDVSTTPAKGGDWTAWAPPFARYAAVVSNYNGELWPETVRTAFEQYLSGGGGFVAVHAANNAFPEWLAYNRMIGLGGWGGRTDKSGPYLRLRAGKWTADPTAGRGGAHGRQHEFVVNTQAPQHPIMAGLPARWKHRPDELYDRLRGPAENVTVLASAHSATETGGSGEEEPLLMAIPFGQGRVFHTALGHGVEAIQCLGFAVTLRRGTEWAATGQVTQPPPADFPTETETKARP
jgi:type 1 glutamine amidotransferase